MKLFDLQEENITESAEELYARGSELFDQGNWKEAIPLILEAANMGNADAQNHLGVDYRLGEGVTKDPQKGIAWYRKAVAQNHPKAQTNLALIYKKGVDLPQDLDEAFRLFSLAAEQGFVKAQTNLGILYEYGEGVAQDYTKAAMWYQKAAEQDFASAQYSLGCLYSQGLGVTLDFVEAKRLWEAAAAKGNKAAQNRLGDLDEIVRRAVEQILEDISESPDTQEETNAVILALTSWKSGNPDPELVDTILRMLSDVANDEATVPTE